ncbi:MAG: NAD(P)H-dependent oxidoreductase subunit E [Clostridiales bacterium]|nr:NAD(P)H-dependent oxidoreductase subunit E [Clostridiales bacterium]
MGISQKTVPFAGTKQQHEELLKVINQHKGDHGALMPILQEAQAIYGYLPIEVQTIISNEMNIPLEKIYGIVTFYSQFSLSPKGKYTISVCLGTACYVRGAGDIVNKLEDILKISDGECTEDGKFSLESCRCIGACGLAPVLTVNDDVYGKITADDVEGILAKYE